MQSRVPIDVTKDRPINLTVLLFIHPLLPRGRVWLQAGGFFADWRCFEMSYVYEAGKCAHQNKYVIHTSV